MRDTTWAAILTREMVAAKDPQEVVDKGYELLGNPIFFHASDGQVGYYTQCVDIPDRHWQKDIVEGGLSLFSLPDSGNCQQAHIDRYQKERLPVRIPTSTEYPERINFVVPIQVFQAFVGMLIIVSILWIPKEEDLPEYQAQFDLVAAIFAEKLRQQMERSVESQKIKDSMLVRLLDGIPIRKDVLDNWLRQTKWRPDPYLHIFVLQFRKLELELENELPSTVERLSASERHRLIQYRGKLVYFYSSRQKRINGTAELQRLQELLRQCNLIGGVSHVFEHIMDARRYYAQAERALALGVKLSHTNPVIVKFDDMYPFILIDMWAQSAEVNDLCSEEVLLLTEYDKENNSELGRTLYRYLQCNHDINLTAERMYVHKNTVRYRIKRCQELLDSDFSDENESFSLLLSFKALEYQRMQELNQQPGAE